MHILTLLAMTVIMAAAETPKTPTAESPKAAITQVQPIAVALNEVQQLRVEKLQLQLQLVEIQQRDLNAELKSVFEPVCAGLGGKSLSDCAIAPPVQVGAKYTVTLKQAPAGKEK